MATTKEEVSRLLDDAGFPEKASDRIIWQVLTAHGVTNVGRIASSLERIATALEHRA